MKKIVRDVLRVYRNLYVMCSQHISIFTNHVSKVHGERAACGFMQLRVEIIQHTELFHFFLFCTY